MYIILAILAFGVLIIVHELGHFTLAKLNGVRVEEFAIGMGPKVLSKQGKETRYSIRLFPIGGYVKMMGEEQAVEDERSFSSKSPLRRISIIIAGAAMNYILALLIFSVIIYNFGYRSTVVEEVTNSSPSYQAGLQTGDKVLKVNDSKIFAYDDILVNIYLAKGDSLKFTVDRSGQNKDIMITPVKDENGAFKIGTVFESNTNPTFATSLKQSFNKTISTVSQTFTGLKMMVTGKANFKTDVGGPLTIIKMSAETAKAGIWTLLNFVAFISVNLAVMNLLPFPALDGGWCIILLIELITRRKVPDKIVEGLNYVGFIALMGFMLLVTIKDILFPIKF